MDFSDDSGDEDERSSPRVTSLDQPGRITIGPNGSVEIGKSNCLPSQPRTQSLASAQYPTALTKEIPTVSGSVSGDAVDISSSHSNTSRQEKNIEKVQNWRSQLTHNGGEHQCIATSTDRKEINLPIYWSQDRYTVTVRVGYPPSIFPTKGIRVRVRGALKYADRYSAVGSGAMTTGYKADSTNSGSTSYGTIEIASLSHGGEKDETILLAGKLPRPIHLNQDEDDIDFEIEDNLLSEGGSEGGNICTKLVSITMSKAVPMAGIYVWWDCPLIGYPTIDVSTIQERNPSRQGGGEGGKSTEENKDEKKEAFQKAWDEAHKMFREKVKTKEKQSINIEE